MLKKSFCIVCGYRPQNRSQALYHAGTCGSIVIVKEKK